MNDSKEMRELEKLSAGLAPKKSSCRICKVLVVASIVLFIATLALVFLESRKVSNNEVAKQRASTPAELSARIQDLRAYAKLKQGTTTSIIVKGTTK